ncbi:guanine nucleotide exchange protein SMCR8 isoform X2 [Lingula anatina]|nr:guanine nucleotide exchange protein SMCR8 isoform X2 [Lingula anatina]XP_013405976.1 guanine nucleotide exchange protein SMCR8 isoform X2 [Lingula anatina]|eukprot:XP_013405975.1 guanine nucleotide exchange protein SMCR8 isoform X2 [Lingula anatina]
MFGGYADVAAYYHPNEEDESIEEHIAPDLLPIYEKPDPWNLRSPIEKDFVLLAEFSELEGPRPVLTIPYGTGGQFDKNNFAVKIMSVDYHNISNNTFTVSDDTQVMILENREGVYAYVHHFTLYDIHARGFVRPFCMAYVTADENKMLSAYEDMLNEFSKVSKCFSYANKLLFLKDIKHHIKNLEHTKECLQKLEGEPPKPNESDSTDENDVLSELTITQVESMIAEAKHIEKVIMPLLTDKKMELKLKQAEDRFFMSRSMDFEEEHEREEEIVQEEINTEEKKEDVNCIKETPRRKASVYSLYSDYKPCRLFDETREYQPQILSSAFFRKKFDKLLRNLHELCPWGSHNALRRLRCIQRYFSRDLATLQIEKEEGTLIDPAAGLLTIGRCVTLNFMQHSGRLADGGYGMSLPSNNLLRRRLSEDTLGSFNSSESFYSIQDDRESVHSGVSSAAEVAFIYANSSHCDEHSPRNRYSISEADDYFVINYKEGDVYEPPKARERYLTGSSAGTSSERSFTTATDISFGTDVDQDLYTTRRSFYDRAISMDSNCTSDDLISSSPTDLESNISRKVAVISAADHIFSLNSSSIGHGILKVFQEYRCSPEILATLLTGRPLVVLGGAKDEKAVTAIVTALWLFLPGHTIPNHAVVPCLSKPKQIKMVDLAHFKLLGMCRPERRTSSPLVPSSVRNYVSVLDIERKMLTAPAYKGHIIKDIYKQRKIFKTEDTYIPFVHCELLELATRAFIYYHCFCQKEPSSFQDNDFAHPLERANVYNMKSTEFCDTRLSVHPGDVPVIEYLSEIVKMQQYDEWARCSYSDTLPTSVKLDLRECKVFKA